jgi:alcohol dehydrogenase class IV
VGDKIARMAHVIGLPEREATPEGLANAVAAMNERIGIPAGLKAMGVPESVFPAVADGALGDHCHLTTPRQPTRAEYIGLMEASYGA